MRLLVVVALIGHILTDYYLTPPENRVGDGQWRALDAAKYICVLLGSSLFFWSARVSAVFAAIAVLHVVINGLTSLLLTARRWQSRVRRANLIIANQLLHVAFIVLIVFVSTTYYQASYTRYIFHVNSLPIAKHILAVLLILNPVNQTFKSFYSHLKIPHKNADQLVVDFNAGRLIGNLERLLIYIMLSLGEYGAIGLIFAAKSITRFSKLNEQDFAEYYLLGTLFSIVATIVIYQFITLIG